MSVYGRVAAHGVASTSSTDAADDDWDTDPDYVNDVSEKEQRKGSKIIQVDKDSVPVSMDAFREQVIQQDNSVRSKEYDAKYL